MTCKTKVNVRNHTMTHFGEKPHKCSHYQKQFIDKGKRNRHINLLHSDLPNKCDQCYNSFKDLNIHIMLFHSDKTIKCKCGKFFCQIK